ncbi:MAG: amidohydrolase family protein, partial [Gammaproteobacteria bacterium]
RDGLRKGVARGVLAAICSDHQPHEPDAKSQPFSATEPGISGLDTLLGLGLRLVEEDVLALPALIERLSTGPARVLGLPLGQLGVGAPADVCVFDLGRRWTLTADTMLSRGHNSPFLGSELFGRVNYTILQGRVAIQSEMSMR